MIITTNYIRSEVEWNVGGTRVVYRMGQGEYSRGFSISPIHRSIKSNILSPSNLIFIITSYKYIIGIEYHILYNIYVIIEAKKLQLEDSQVICKYRRVIYVYNGICISDLYCPCNGPSFIPYILAYIIPLEEMSECIYRGG